jgi:hypothetical protein
VAAGLTNETRRTNNTEDTVSAEDHHATFHFHNVACAQDDYVEVILASDTMPNHKMTFALTSLSARVLSEELLAAARKADPIKGGDTYFAADFEASKDRDRSTP